MLRFIILLGKRRKFPIFKFGIKLFGGGALRLHTRPFVIRINMYTRQLPLGGPAVSVVETEYIKGRLLTDSGLQL